MDKKRDTRIDLLFILILLVFIFFKWSHLTLPYIFDEANFYGPAVIKMYENGPSLSPVSIPVFYSRGHPLLFHFLGASWMQLFGTSILSSHIFALCISIILLISVYYFCSKAFNQTAGIISTISICVQPLFLAQSNLVLPEMLLALLMVTTLLSYLDNNKIVYWIAAALAMMTKESALILFCTLPIYRLYLLKINPADTFSNFIKDTLFILSPISIWLLFLIWQKLTLGWFFFPEHQGLIILTPSVVWEKFARILLIVFIWSGRNSLTLLSIIFLFYYYIKSKKLSPTITPYLILFTLFILLFSSFSALNFFTNRYIISLVILVSILTGCILSFYSTKKYVIAISILIILISGGYNILTLRYDCDHNLGYVDKANDSNKE